MNCPFCHHKNTKVLDSRLLKKGTSIRRRRECSSCERRFTTYESIEISLPRICKNDGRREDFNREKIYSGIEKACQKLPVSPEQINQIIDSVEKRLMEFNQSEIKSRVIGNLVIMHLRHLNPVAFVRFASVYKSFENIDDFFQNLKLEEEKFSLNFTDLNQ
ncbi:MAG: transcriptional repressor NrdR [Halobacteriovoraceae bacterium]|nr:transcriptional repressor NrdR [Halobacteriovoraceae bacterium]MCB9094180.1 transcriptional repressor NrdR [Halobacteriovoraceae bacterium]